MNGGAGAGWVDFFHGFQVALMMTVMLNLTQFVYWRCKASRAGKGAWFQWQPVLWTFISTVLVNIQPMMILSIGSFKICCATCENMGFDANCTATGRSLPPWADKAPRVCDWSGNTFWDESYCTGQKLPIFPTQTSGWLVQILATWGGFVFMFVGIMQATQLHKKFLNKWYAVRSGRA